MDNLFLPMTINIYHSNGAGVTNKWTIYWGTGRVKRTKIKVELKPIWCNISSNKWKRQGKYIHQRIENYFWKSRSIDMFISKADIGLKQWNHHHSLVIRQKGESQNGGNKKIKHAKFSEKQTFLIPWYAHVRVRIRG